MLISKKRINIINERIDRIEKQLRLIFDYLEKEHEVVLKKIPTKEAHFVLFVLKEKD